MGLALAYHGKMAGDAQYFAIVFWIMVVVFNYLATRRSAHPEPYHVFPAACFLVYHPVLGALVGFTSIQTLIGAIKTLTEDLILFLIRIA